MTGPEGAFLPLSRPMFELVCVEIIATVAGPVKRGLLWAPGRRDGRYVSTVDGDRWADAIHTEKAKLVGLGYPDAPVKEMAA